jgi:hypothetical protein
MLPEAHRIASYSRRPRSLVPEALNCLTGLGGGLQNWGECFRGRLRTRKGAGGIEVLSAPPKNPGEPTLLGDLWVAKFLKISNFYGNGIGQ